MQFTSLKVPGREAIRFLNEHRSRYSDTGQYPFLIGDGGDLERVRENATFNENDAAAIIRASLDIKPTEWLARRKKEADEWIARYREETGEHGFSPYDETLGEWTGEIFEKGSIALHRDVLSGRIKPTVYIGLAKIETPWHLPAIVKYGGWNNCPEPQVHCAFHREWQKRFGAEIAGMSGDVIECTVRKPPTDRDTAINLAWEQYWYCGDIVEQGCGTICHLTATLMNSPYWYFWWD
jgi:hypothetical protein